MSRKNTLKYDLFPTGQSLATSFISPVTFIRNTDNVSYQIDVTTTDSIGTFTVQVSDNYSVANTGAVENPGTWITLTLSGVPVVAATNDIIGISLNQLPYDAIRLIYTSTTAGTGSCRAILTSKMIGG